MIVRRLGAAALLCLGSALSVAQIAPAPIDGSNPRDAGDSPDRVNSRAVGEPNPGAPIGPGRNTSDVTGASAPPPLSPPGPVTPGTATPSPVTPGSATPSPVTPGSATPAPQSVPASGTTLTPPAGSAAAPPSGTGLTPPSGFSTPRTGR